MFAYSPTPDRSGEIMAAGTIGAAQANQQMMSQLGSDIGGALKSIGGSIGESMKEAREGESAYTALQSMGQMYPALGKITGALDQLDPKTRHMAARQVLGNFGALSQFAIAGMNNQTRQQGQALTARGQDITINMPAARAQTAAQAAVASGQGTINRSSIGYNPAALRGRSNP